jgi:hypothetical protein
MLMWKSVVVASKPEMNVETLKYESENGDAVSQTVFFSSESDQDDI